MLTYDLSKKEKLTIYEYLYKCIKRDILEGELTAHERLPSKREFAKHHQISLKTVENTYDQLLTEGYIYSEEKRGYFVMPMGHDLDLQVFNKKPLFGHPSGKRMNTHWVCFIKD